MNSPLTKALGEIKERLEKSTPGPWKYEVSPYCYDGQVIFQDKGTIGPLVVASHKQHAHGNGPLIAHAPSDIARLLRIVEIQQKALEFYARQEHLTTYWVTMPEGYSKPTTTYPNETGDKARQALADAAAVVAGE